MSPYQPISWRRTPVGSTAPEPPLEHHEAPPAPADASLLTQKVIGYRQWRCCNGSWPLRACAWNVDWTAGVQTAGCTVNRPHHAPAPSCTCGLYAYYDLRNVYVRATPAGIVVAWGRTEAHADGFRAEHAQIIALIGYPGQTYPSGTGFHSAHSRFDDVHIESLARVYKVPDRGTWGFLDVRGRVRNACACFPTTRASSTNDDARAGT